MRYESARNFRAAIDARLKRLAGTTDESHLVRARRGIAFERFLARLFTTAPDRWTLKGGLALDYRLGDKARATKDIDLVTPLEIDELEEDLVKALGTDLGDFFDYSIRSSQVLDLATEGSARRYHIRADLDGRQFGNFTVDIGFDKPSPIAPDHSTGRGFLDFAGVERIAMPVIAIEIHLAEKVHAYCRTYAGNRQNTRVKDLIDIVLIGEFPTGTGKLTWESDTMTAYGRFAWVAATATRTGGIGLARCSVEDEHGSGAPLHHLGGGASDHEAADAGMAIGAHHQQVDPVQVHRVDDRLFRLAHLNVRRNSQAAGFQVAHGIVQSGAVGISSPSNHQHLSLDIL